MEKTRKCDYCNETKPLTNEYFGYTPSKNFRRKCRTCMNKYSREYRIKNMEKSRERRRKYEKNKNRYPGSVSSIDKLIIREKLNNRCYYCGISVNKSGEFDHMIPLSKNGKNIASNMTLACRKCNRDKRDKNVYQFLKWRIERNLIIRDDVSYKENLPECSDKIVDAIHAYAKIKSKMQREN